MREVLYYHRNNLVWFTHWSTVLFGNVYRRVPYSQRYLVVGLVEIVVL